MDNDNENLSRLWQPAGRLAASVIVTLGVLAASPAALAATAASGSAAGATGSSSGVGTTAIYDTDGVFFLDPQFDNIETEGTVAQYAPLQTRGAEQTRGAASNGVTNATSSATAGFAGALWGIAAAGALILAAFNSRKRRPLIGG